MSLMDKIEEIRKKPENERIKYVWFMVFLCMLVIIFIWIISFKSMFSGEEKVNSGTESVGGIEKSENIDNSLNNNESNK